MHPTIAPSCYRIPCDTAYRRGAHWGPHVTSRGERNEYDAERDEWRTVWSVANVAERAEPWLVRVRIGDYYLDMDSNDAQHFAESVLKATHGALSARLSDETARREEAEESLKHAEAAAELQLDDGRFGTRLEAEAVNEPTAEAAR